MFCLIRFLGPPGQNTQESRPGMELRLERARTKEIRDFILKVMGVIDRLVFFNLQFTAVSGKRISCL